MEEIMEEIMEEKQMEPVEPESAELKKTKGFRSDDRGVGVIEIVLILVVLIGLVLIFKQQITTIVNNAFSSISGNAGKIIN